MSAALPATEPLIVGAAQLSDHGEPTPNAMLAAVAREALADSGEPEAMLAALDSLGAVESVSWPIGDPAREIATAIGAEPLETVLAVTGGTAPIELLADSCRRISAGERRAVLIAGVECVDVLMRAMKQGREPNFPQQAPGTAPSRVIGEPAEATHPVERDAGLIAPVAYYPLFESALRRTAGRNPADHQRYLGELWARFAVVAAENPFAWSREAPSAAAIATASAANRQVSIPYTKLMNSNIQTNQAAALLLCSRGLADEAGIEPQRRVAIRSTASASDHPFASSRVRFDRSPALAACARDALGHAGLEIGEIPHLDIYSCFPSAVEVAAAELGLDPFAPQRPLTVTGGLSFAGGPGSNYVTHSLAALSGRLRAGGGHGLATGVGWYLTKHGVVLLTADREEVGPGYAHFSPQREIDAGPERRIVPPPESGSAEIAAYTAIYSREGEPEIGIATFEPGPNERTVARADDAGTLAQLAASDALGRRARFSGGGRFELS
jgi:acetyl-CoA C-acetyltransferase